MSKIFTQAGPDNALIGDCMIQMPAYELLHLAESAAAQLLFYFDPNSTQYVAPAANPGYAFEPHAQNVSGLMARRAGIRGPWGQLFYLGVWAQLDTVDHVANLMNQSPDSSFAGEEGHTRQLIYSALRVTHNWKAQCIDLTHAERGRRFGSATGWQTHSIIKPVRNWPERYPVHVQAGYVLELPCDRVEA